MPIANKILKLLLLCVAFAGPAMAQSESTPELVPADTSAAAPTATPTETLQPSAATQTPEDGAELPVPSTAADLAPEADVAALTDPTEPVAATQIEPDASADRAALKAYIDGVVSSLQREHGLAGLTLAVVKDDSLWLAQGYGEADLSRKLAVQADTTRFRIGSVSKTFIWTAAMMLVERGQLDLDADVNSYLKKVHIVEAFGTPVTMRHLMHHRAGFEDSMRLFAVADDDTRTLNEVLSEQQPKRVYAPGLRTSYSNWGAALAAQVVEDVSGVPYGDFLQHEILDPLAMRDTSWTAPGKLDAAGRANLADGYKSGSGALDAQSYMQIGAYWPAGGIASTANDMSRWMRMHLNGGELEGVRLMSAETHARMWTRGYDDRPGAADLAHGFQDRSYHGLRLLGHGGATAAFLSNMVLVPELRLGIFVSQNSAQTRLPISQLPELIVDHLHESSYQATLAVTPGDPGVLSEVDGSYLQNRRVFSSFAAVLGLNSVGTVSARSADAVLISIGDQAKQYLRVGQERDLFEAADGSRVAFVREGGRVVALADSSGVHTLEKLGVLGMPNTLFGALGGSLLLALSSLLGFWWRLGRGPAYGAGLAAGLAASASLLSALCVIGFAVVVVLLVIDLSAFDLSTMAASYPSEAMRQTHYAGWVMAGAAAAMLLALWPAWIASGWGLWRRLHFTVFTLLLTLGAYLLWQWKVFDAPVY
jgi:CubicO group peptidase (beta-lactamase class C family)